jgi:hypothetical protein
MTRAPRQYSALLSVIALSALLFACGGGGTKTVELDEWVESLCDAAADFEDASDEAGEEFLEADFEDTEGAKEAFANSVEAQRDAQKDFRDAFNDIGKPDIDGGDEVVDAFVEQFEKNDEQTADLADAIADIDDDADFTEAFFDAIEEFEEPDFRGALEDVADDHDEVNDLIEAIDDDEDCAATIFNDGGSVDDNGDDPAPTRAASGTPTTSRTPAAATTASERWVSGICTSFTEWVLDLEVANRDFQAELDATTGDTQEIKELLIEFMELGRDETDELRREVAALPRPTGSRGAEVHGIFATAAEDLVDVFDDLIVESKAISTASEAQTRADIDALVDSVGAAFDEVSEGFDALDDIDLPEIEALFESRPECEGF